MTNTLIKAKDFNSVEISGVTNATANIVSRFKHGKQQVPFMWIILEGQVYIPRNGAGPDDFIVCSTINSEPFRIILFFN